MYRPVSSLDIVFLEGRGCRLWPGEQPRMLGSVYLGCNIVCLDFVMLESLLAERWIPEMRWFFFMVISRNYFSIENIFCIFSAKFNFLVNFR